MLEKRYQVFVSSTFADLQEERQAVIQSLLELNCIPCSMEFFPADNDEVWDAIKKLIAECDYYVVVVAGRYGSVSSDGISYTEKEYRFAMEAGVPALAFLHSNPDSLPVNRSEKDPILMQKLQDFRELCGKRMCKKWATAGDLRAAVTTSLVSTISKFPRMGWVRASHVPDESAAQTIARLHGQIEDLQQQVEHLRRQSPNEPDTIPGGSVPFVMNVSFYLNGVKNGEVTFVRPLNEIFERLAPSLMTSCSESELRSQLGSWAQRLQEKWLGETYIEHGFRELIIRLRTLDLIEPTSNRQAGMWGLTLHGEKQLFRLKDQSMATPLAPPAGEPSPAP